MMRRLLSIILGLLLCMVPLAPMAHAEPTMATVKTSSGSGVNLRTGPGSTVKGWVPEGASVEIISTSGNWCRVKVLSNWAPKPGFTKNSNVGYIYKPYLSRGGNSTSSNLAAKIGATGNVARVRTKTVLRKGAGSGYARIATLSAGTKLVVHNTAGNWLRVTVLRSSKNIQGYVAKNTVSRGLPGRITSSCHLREGGSNRFGSITVMGINSSITIIYIGSTWSQVRYGKRTGYVDNRYIKFS